jgi:hypothetical protein
VAGHPFPPLNQGVLKGSQVEQFFAESAIAAKELEQAVVNTAKASKKGLTIKHLLESIPTASPSTVCCLVEYMVSEGRMVFDGSNYYYRS